MAITLLENKTYVMNVIPNEKDKTLPGRLIRNSEKFKTGQHKGNASKYYLVELTDKLVEDIDGYVSVDESERGRIVFTVMELTDKKRFDLITSQIMKMFNTDKVAEVVAKEPLVDVKVSAKGAYYKVAIPHTDSSGVKRDMIRFFVRASENALDAVSLSLDYIKQSSGITLEKIEPGKLPDVIQEVQQASDDPASDDDPFN